ncbi:MAG TPA: putative glycoside hydrolase [Candidatus Binatia bacterium]
MKGTFTSILPFVSALIFLFVGVDELPRRGRVYDAVTLRPIEGAFVTLGDAVARTETNGGFQMRGSGTRIGARAFGYQRTWIDLTQPQDGLNDVALRTFTPKALYLSFYGVGDFALRESALRLIESTELNAVVIDVKGDRGRIPYKSAVPLSAQVGAQSTLTIKDIEGLLKSLRGKGIYTIARIVVFKDNPLASAKPDWAVKLPGGAIWHDREDLAWTDPFNEQVWEYNLAVAEEAARYGFDEIQFDYVRFPDARGLVYSMPNTMENRVRAVSDFLRSARRKLVPYNVFVAADIFGYVCWNLDDTGIGQRLDQLAPYLDYLSPMLYPSGFHVGIPGIRDPVAHPYEIVYRSLARAKERTGLPGVRFRPWLQAFRDYAFDHRPFTGKEIGLQIKAATDFGSNGWMLWNPSNVYSPDGLSVAIN